MVKSQTTEKEMIVVNYQREGLPFVNIVLKNKNIGTYSNEQGRFSIVCEQNDTLIISAIGYETQFVSCFDMRDTIFLNAQMNLLPELTIKGKKDKQQAKILTVGYIKDKTNGHFGGMGEAILFIPNQKEITAKIRSVVFKVENKKIGEFFEKKVVLLRLTLYSRKPNSIFPDKSIVKESLIKKLKRNHNKIISFDISDWDMVFPVEGIFVGIELLGHQEGDVFIPFDSNKKNREHHFAPSFSRNYNSPQSFIRNEYGQIWKSASLRDDRTFSNFNFGIEVEY